MNNKIPAFEYIVFKMVEWHIDKVGPLNFKQFFESDLTFPKEKALLFPFFVCTANGIRKQMFEFFDNFHAAEFGHCEKDITSSLDKLQILRVINDRIVCDKTFLEIYGNSKIVSEEICKIVIGGERTAIYDKIDHSIQKLRERVPDFVLFESEALRFYSQRHISWRMYWKLFKMKGLKLKINPDIMISEASMFAEEAEKRILV